MGIGAEVLRRYLIGWYESIVTLGDNLDLILLQCELEQGDLVIGHKLGRYATADEVRKLLLAAYDVLRCVNALFTRNADWSGVLGTSCRNSYAA